MSYVVFNGWVSLIKSSSGDNTSVYTVVARNVDPGLYTYSVSVVYVFYHGFTGLPGVRTFSELLPRTKNAKRTVACEEGRQAGNLTAVDDGVRP